MAAGGVRLTLVSVRTCQSNSSVSHPLVTEGNGGDSGGGRNRGGRRRKVLDVFGLPVRVAHGDDVWGFFDGAPYGRIIATCGLRSVPYAWVEQCRPGGRTVLPWGRHHGNGDAVVRPAVSRDGRSASGPFTGPVEFMKLRAQRLPPVVHSVYSRATWPTRGVVHRASGGGVRWGTGSGRGTSRSGSWTV